MFKNTPHKIRAFRFRRWSRKKYAAFNSLGRCVSIGTLGSRISECTLRKQRYSSIRINRDHYTDDQTSDPDNALPEAITGAMLQLAAIPTFKREYADIYLRNFTTLQKSRRECHMAHSPAFLHLIPNEL